MILNGDNMDEFYALREEIAKMQKALEFYADEKNWKDVETGIGMMNSPAVDDFGATAREALT